MIKARALQWSLLCVLICSQVSQAGDFIIGQVAEGSKETRILLNPIDLGSDWKKSTFLNKSKSEKLWLWTSNGMEVAIYDGFEVTREETDPSFKYSGSVVLKVKSNVLIPNGHLLISDKPLVEQKWKSRRSNQAETSFALSEAKARFEKITGEPYKGKKTYNDPGLGDYTIDLNSITPEIVSSEKGTLMLLRFPVPGYAETRLVVLQLEGKKWKEITSSNEDSFPLSPWLDINGDSFPEFFHCGEGGYSCDLMSIYPSYESVLKWNSGV